MSHSQALEQLGARREQILGDLAKLEKQVYDVENTYFTAEYTNLGTVLKGFEGFLGSRVNRKDRVSRVFKVEDRLFSLSSTTSPASQELQAERDQQVVDTGGLTARGKGVVYGNLQAAQQAKRRY